MVCSRTWHREAVRASPGAPSGTIFVSMHNDESTADADALLSRLRVIEDQPLDTRATAFAQLHDELQARLEGGDAPAAHG